MTKDVNRPRTGAYANRPGLLLQLWVSEDALARIRAAAAADTYNVAAWCRRVLYAKVGIESRNDGGVEPADAACGTCLGAGKLRDGEIGELRKCLDCNGSGRQS